MIRFLLGISRAPFLPLSLLCAATGISAADGFTRQPGLAGLALLAAVLAHASVNAFNEYADYRSGLDLHTSRTPFSGGSGTLPALPQHLPLARIWAWLTLAVTLGIGLYFVQLRGWWLGGLGLLGALLVITYTPFINRNPWLCLLAPGIGFGPVLVVGSSVAVSGQVPPASVWAAVLMAVLTSGLLLANQQPDAAVDARFGRRHLAIAYGPRYARRVLALLWCLPLPLWLVAWFSGTWASGAMPGLAAVAILPLVLAMANARLLLSLAPESPLPVALLGRNVLVCLTEPLLLALALPA